MHREHVRPDTRPAEYPAQPRIFAPNPDSFSSNFEIVAADTPVLLDAAHALRYQVYCVEQGYEDAGRFADRRERDEYDTRAVQCLVRHRATGIHAGVVRVVLPDRRDLSAALPMEAWWGDRLDRLALARLGVRRSAIAEASRFAISKTFRRRILEASNVVGASPTSPTDDDGHGRRQMPQIILGLIAAAIDRCRRAGIAHMYTAMEPSLPRLLARYGLRFTAVGPALDYHGQRLPLVGVVDEMYAGFRHTQPELAELFEHRAASTNDFSACAGSRHPPAWCDRSSIRRPDEPRSHAQ